jgi:hypothetical protein
METSSEMTKGLRSRIMIKKSSVCDGEDAVLTKRRVRSVRCRSSTFPICNVSQHAVDRNKGATAGGPKESGSAGSLRDR